MSKFFNLFIAISMLLGAGLPSLTTAIATAQEYPGCFIIMPNGLTDLNAWCGGQGDGTATGQTIAFNNLRLQSILNDSLVEVVGTATNQSGQVSPISVVYFELVANNQVLTTSAIEVEAGNGLSPGQSMEFSKVISASDLRSQPTSNISIRVIEYR